MGGRVPVEYNLRDRKLLVNKKEAEQVGRIFERYRELGCVAQLKDRLDREGVKAKCASARLVESQEGSIKCCFRAEEAARQRYRGRFSQAPPSRASSSGISRCIGSSIRPQQP
jgi:hypothetical protein